MTWREFLLLGKTVRYGPCVIRSVLLEGATPAQKKREPNDVYSLVEHKGRQHRADFGPWNIDQHLTPWSVRSGVLRWLTTSLLGMAFLLWRYVGGGAVRVEASMGNISQN